MQQKESFIITPKNSLQSKHLKAHITSIRHQHPHRRHPRHPADPCAGGSKLTVRPRLHNLQQLKYLPVLINSTHADPFIAHPAMNVAIQGGCRKHDVFLKNRCFSSRFYILLKKEGGGGRKKKVEQICLGGNANIRAEQAASLRVINNECRVGAGSALPPPTAKGDTLQ